AAQADLAEEAVTIAALRDHLEETVIRDIPDAHVNGIRSPRLPGVSSITFPGVPADALLAAIPQIAASDGSACNAGALEPSHVLIAMGLSRDEADCTVRFSLGYATTISEIDQATALVVRAVSRLRATIAIYPPIKFA